MCCSVRMMFYCCCSILVLILYCLKKNIYWKPGQTGSFQTDPDSERLQFVIACLFLSSINSLLFLRPLLCLSGSVGGHPALHGQSGDEERQPWGGEEAGDGRPWGAADHERPGHAHDPWADAEGPSGAQRVRRTAFVTWSFCVYGFNHFSSAFIVH